MRWRNAHAKEGENAFVVRFSNGRPPKLSPSQLRRLEKALLKGPMALGFSTDLWTTKRIVQVIEKMFQISFHKDHIGRLMARMGWSHQKPERRALERNEDAIEKWKEQEWPRVKKTPKGWVPISFS